MADRTVEETSIPLDRDIFFRSLIRELSGTLEEIVGLRETSGFIALVGQRIGDEINQQYRSALSADDGFDRSKVARILVDLKHRIGGEFFVIEENEDRIVFGNHRCPFGEKVKGRTSMCMMTSNVFGSITADNLGFAKVELRETIARGAPGCVVVVHLKPSAEASSIEGREYVRA